MKNQKNVKHSWKFEYDPIEIDNKKLFYHDVNRSVPKKDAINIIFSFILLITFIVAAGYLVCILEG